MKKKMLLIFILSAASLFVLPSSLPAVTIDFNGATPGVFLTADYFEDGFKMECSAGHYDFWYHGGGTGDTTYVNIDLFETGTPSTVRFSTISGMNFHLSDLDVIDTGGTLKSSVGGSMSLSGSGVVTFSGPNWSNLEWLDFTLAGTECEFAGIDTINVNPVPVPAAVLLLGSGLVGLAGFRRRLKN